MAKLITKISFLICAVSFAHSANILSIFPFPGKSHYVMFERLLRGLAEKGHDVDVVTHFPAKDAPKGYFIFQPE